MPKATVQPRQPNTPQESSIPHKHIPHNVNLLHKAEQEAAGFNTWLAILLTKSVGTMWTAYAFAVLAVVGLLAILGILNPLTALLVAWTSQTLIQLTLLPIIMVGQNVLGRHAELLAEEQFNTTQKTYADIEQVMAHLDAQDAKIIALQEHSLEILKRLEDKPARSKGKMAGGAE